MIGLSPLNILMLYYMYLVPVGLKIQPYPYPQDGRNDLQSLEQHIQWKQDPSEKIKAALQGYLP